MAMNRKFPINEVYTTCGKTCSAQINYLIQKCNIAVPVLNEDECYLIDSKLEEEIMTPEDSVKADTILKKYILVIFRNMVPQINEFQNMEIKTAKNKKSNMDIMLTMVNSLTNLADQMPAKYYRELFVEIFNIVETLNSRAALKFCSTTFSRMFYEHRMRAALNNKDIKDQIEDSEHVEYYNTYGPVIIENLLKLYQTWLNIAGNAKCLQEVPHTIENIELFISEWNLTGQPQECEIWHMLWQQLQKLSSMHKTTFVSNFAIDRESAFVLTEKVMLKMLAASSRVNTEAQSKELAETCILYSLKDKHCYLYDSLLNTKPVQLLKGTPRFQLLEIFTNGTLSDYRHYAASSEGQQFLEEMAESERVRTGRADINPQIFLEKKIRQLTFIELAGQCIRNKRYSNGEPNTTNDCSISIEQLREELELKDDISVEEFIIDAIRTNMVKAKLSQSERKVIIHHAVPRQFTRNHWEELNNRLNNWKEQIAKIHLGFDEIINNVAPEVFRNSVKI